MTARERFSREALVRRAVVAAGAFYVAPVVTSSVEAATSGRCRGPCAGDKKCQHKGGKECLCIDGQCNFEHFCPTLDCGAVQCCDALNPCDPGPDDCACFLKMDDLQPHCVGFPSDSCADYPTCTTTAECPPGTCCMCTCCPTGICAPAPCTTGAGGTKRRASGPTLTR